MKLSRLKQLIKETIKNLQEQGMGPRSRGPQNRGRMSRMPKMGGVVFYPVPGSRPIPISNAQQLAQIAQISPIEAQQKMTQIQRLSKNPNRLNEKEYAGGGANCNNCGHNVTLGICILGGCLSIGK